MARNCPWGLRDMGERDELYKLRGKTLQAYLYMLRRREPIGVRELQRSLGFSSPSVAHHHLEKLREMGLVSKDDRGRYWVSEKVDVGVLKMFLVVGGRLVPRFLFYAVFLTTLLALYVVQNLNDLNPYALVFAVFSSAFFWVETVRLWRHRLW